MRLEPLSAKGLPRGHGRRDNIIVTLLVEPLQAVTHLSFTQR